ncbi:hypothetical protein Rhsp01_36190 [Rhizobium sp. NBRC 114257]|nr:hypothetical protein Rhsp01_36190 [Rhizobium sp. NBRC 114257]
MDHEPQDRIRGSGDPLVITVWRCGRGGCWQGLPSFDETKRRRHVPQPLFACRTIVDSALALM